LREDKGLLLCQSAAFLEVDTAFVSKVERGERKASKEQVERLAQFLEADKYELITLWLSDKILEVINNEKQAEAALKLALKEQKSK
jgi:transcriptional regulator with XRE-family HTH domain